MRYEHKYRITDATRDEVEYAIKCNSASFQTAYPNRFINSIYLDDTQLTATNENIAGIAQRTKYRLRWYGADIQNIQNPILEKKIKDNQLGTKEYEKMPSFDLRAIEIMDYFNQYFSKKIHLHPVVIIRYQRSYFESFDNKVRATIDWGLEYYYFNGNHFFPSPVHDDAVILEIKFAADYLEQADYLLQEIPFRLTKNSKFVSGVISTGG